ncbi:MAG: DMT family transporter [Pseudomonadota bacterium]
MDIDNPRVKHIVAWTTMLIVGTLWGATIPLSKTAVSTGHQPLGLITWQLLIGVVLLGSYLLMRGWRPVFSRKHLIFYLVIAILGTIIPNGFSYYAASHLPAGVMSIAIATVPMFTLMMALVFRLENFDLWRVLGIGIGFTAMAMIAAPETSLPEPEKAIFVLFALIAPICYGGEANFIAVNTPDRTDAVSTLFMASCIGFVLVLPMSIVSGQWLNPMPPWGVPELALISASVIHAITYVGYIWLVGFGGPVFSVQVAYPVTLSGVFLSIVFLGEGYSGWIWAALVLIIIGLLLVQPKLDDLKMTGEEHE